MWDSMPNFFLVRCAESCTTLLMSCRRMGKYWPRWSPKACTLSVRDRVRACAASSISTKSRWLVTRSAEATAFVQLAGAKPSVEGMRHLGCVGHGGRMQVLIRCHKESLPDAPKAQRVQNDSNDFGCHFRLLKRICAARFVNLVVAVRTSRDESGHLARPVPFPLPPTRIRHACSSDARACNAMWERLEDWARKQASVVSKRIAPPNRRSTGSRAVSWRPGLKTVVLHPMCFCASTATLHADRICKRAPLLCAILCDAFEPQTEVRIGAATGRRGR